MGNNDKLLLSESKDLWTDIFKKQKPFINIKIESKFPQFINALWDVILFVTEGLLMT